ncbi:MAG: response regulator receiver protein [Thermoleophilia bacterium]|nr:response regulator receiver protein [Thermoleophilia bacterium]
MVTVDDAVAMQKLIKLMLELEPDISVIAQAGDGRAAVDLAERHQPDVVLLDIAMPVMDGIEALPLIRDRAPGTRVVMVTGFGTPALREQCAALGAADSIDKGSIAGTIVDAVRRAAAA